MIILCLYHSPAFRSRHFLENYTPPCWRFSGVDLSEAVTTLSLLRAAPDPHRALAPRAIPKRHQNVNLLALGFCSFFLYLFLTLFPIHVGSVSHLFWANTRLFSDADIKKTFLFLLMLFNTLFLEISLDLLSQHYNNNNTKMLFIFLTFTPS